MEFSSADRIHDNQYLYTNPDNPFELDHEYGRNVHVLAEPTLLTILSRLGDPKSSMYEKLNLVDRYYRILLNYIVHAEFELEVVRTETPMACSEGENGYYVGPAIASSNEVVLVSIIRGGAYPTERLKEALSFLTGRTVRTDYLTMERVTDEQDAVIGVEVTGQKIPASVSGKIVILPDPMGATGGTMKYCYRLYTGVIATEKGIEIGRPRKLIAMHLATAPEYIREITKACPDLKIYTGRVDRGLSTTEVLDTKLGTREDEKGLNEKDYIVPGLGGVGEMLSGES